MLHQFEADELRRAINGANFGLWSWNVKSDEIRWSSQAGHIYGLEPKDYPDNITALAKLLPSTTALHLRTQIFASVSHKDGQFEFEHPILRLNGSNGWVRNSGHVEFDEHNNPSKLTAFAVDITTQKQAEVSAQKREDLFRRLSELTADYIYEVNVTDPPFVPSVVAGSYDRVVGYTNEELKEKGGWTGIMNADDLAASESVLEQLNAGVPTFHDYRIQNNYGETRWLRDHSCPIIEDGKMVRLIGGVKDITETKNYRTNCYMPKSTKR